DKQILISEQGQTITTTDGTSIAQAKVHVNTENDLNKADKIFVSRFLNKELKQRHEKRVYNV
ncbi:phage portal protein family protein, partial [Ornithobacterium rhinotracheale]